MTLRPRKRVNTKDTHMKKLLTIAALAACIPAFATTAEVTSSNTVGYQKIALGTGFNWVAPQFLNIGGQGINIQAIQLKFAEGCEAEGGDNLQILDEGGAMVAGYSWFPADWYGGTVDGWVNGDGDALVNVTLQPGQSVLIDIEQEGTSVYVNGEVADDDYSVEAVQGFNFVGNTTPVVINVQDIQLDFGDGAAQGGDNLQILDDGGAMVAGYSWFPADWYGGTVDGWVNGDGDALVDFTLDPGQGVLIDSEQEGTIIKVPAAL